MRTLIVNCRVVSPGIDLASGAVLIENGTVSSICDGGSPLPPAGNVIDGTRTHGDAGLCRRALSRTEQLRLL